MANPKRRHSKSRRDKRRGQWKLTAPMLSRCPQCGAFRKTHHVCSACGSYRGKQRIQIPVKEKKAER